MNWSGYISESLKDIKVFMGRDINICINYPTPRGDQRETKNCLLNGGNNRWSPQRIILTRIPSSEDTERKV